MIAPAPIFQPERAPPGFFADEEGGWNLKKAALEEEKVETITKRDGYGGDSAKTVL